MKLIPRLSVLALAWLHLTAAWPQSAHYTDSTDEMLWFLTITDSHIGQGIMGADQDSDNLRWALGELFQTVQPSFLVNAGDLVDGTGGGPIPVGQFDKEWNEYNQIVTEAGMTAAYYFDLPGNHDNYAEWPMAHYLNSSIQGKANNRLNHSWTRTDAKGNKYFFLGLATNGNDKSLWLDDPGLDSTDRDFGNAAFAEHSDASVAFLFGHHPVGNLEEGQDTLVNWFLDHAVSGYMFGHSHDYSLEWGDGTLEINVRSTAKNDDRQVGLFAYDGLGLSAKVFDVGAWPQVLITTPVDSNLGGNNPYDYMIPDSLTDARVKAIAFHPDGVASVTALLDGTTTIPMELVEDNVWVGPFDASQLSDEGPHTLKVTAEAWGASNAHQITFYVFHDETPPDPVDPSPESDDLGTAEENPEQDESDLIEETMEPSEDLEVITQPDSSEDLAHDLYPYDSFPSDLAQDTNPWDDQATQPDSPAQSDSWDKDSNLPASDVPSSSDQLAGDLGPDSDQTDAPANSLGGGGCAASHLPSTSPLLLLALFSLLLLPLRRR